jgi:hypothetical protein
MHVKNDKNGWDVFKFDDVNGNGKDDIIAENFPPHEIMIMSEHKSIKTYEIYIKVIKRNVRKR